MKLCDEVKSVLDLACPVWMQKLCAVDFDMEKLDLDDARLLQQNFTSCFIGEIHHRDGKRDSYENINEEYSCEQCSDFACAVPRVFAESGYGRSCYVSKQGFVNFLSDIEGRKKLLKYIAKHVKKEHPELMNKKPLENDC